MKSKISFFNKTVFKKNVTLYWPIWAGYLLFLLGVQPFALWLSFENGSHFESYTAQDKFQDFIGTYEYMPIGWFIVFAAVIVGMALYSYIYNAKSANMIHALPVDKTQLFGTNVVSGLAFLIVPQIVAAIISAGVCLGYGINRLDIIGLALVRTIATAFVAYGIVTFCAMFTGLLVALPLYVLIFNYLAKWVYFMIQLAVSVFAHGVSGFSRSVHIVFDVILAPMSALGGYIGFNEVYEDEVLVGLEIFAGKLLAVYVVMAIALYVIAYFTYKKRHIEQAGEWITVEWLKPVFRFGAGTTAGIYGGIFIKILLDQIGIQLEGIAVVILIVLLGGIGYFLAEMIVRKNFRVFQKKNWIHCGIFSVILVLLYGGLFQVADYMEKYVPEKEEIEAVSVHMGYDIRMDGEEAQQVLEKHKIIIENIDAIQAEAERIHDDGEHFTYVNFQYRLKNGDYVDRHYTLYEVNDEISGIINEMIKLESNPENFLESNLCKRYDEVTVFGESQLEVQFTKDIVGKDPDGYLGYAYDTLVFTPEQTKELYEAVIADVRSGALIKYNTNSYYMYMEDKNMGTVSLYLRFKDPDAAEPGTQVYYEDSASILTDTMIDYEYDNMQSTYLSIGKDCENVLNKLIEFGYIESVDDIYWGEYEE